VLFGASVQADDSLIRTEVSKQIVEASPWSGEDVEVDEITITGPGNSKAKFDRVDVRVPKRMSNIGKVTVFATLYSGRKEVGSVWVSARIRVFKEALVALNSIRINELITRDDVKVMRMEARELTNTLGSADEAVGMLARRPISAGSVIKKDYIKPQIIVKRGETIVVLVENKRIRIKSSGTAVRDGSRGDTVAVKMSSGKEISGRVTAPGEISVDF